MTSFLGDREREYVERAAAGGTGLAEISARRADLQPANKLRGAQIGVQFEEPDNEVWSSDSYWVVLKNWRSPRYPDGATSDVGAYVLVSERLATDADDPVVDFTTTRMRPDGAPE